MIEADTLTTSEQLRVRRKALGLSLSEVARRVGTSPATLSRYENGWNRFELYTLRKLASALDCELRIVLQPLCGETESRPDVAPAVRKLGRLFWDRKLEASDLAAYPVWVVERVLEYGNLDDIRTLRSLMGREQFLQTTAQAVRVSARTRNFWKQILKMEGIPCTKKFCQNTVWDS